MGAENHDEIDEFKKILLSVMHTIGKECTEKEFRKAYHAIRHENVNVMVDKLGAANLPHFLRYKCRDIFEVYQREKHGEIKILRLECAAPETEPKAEKKKVKKSSSAPKLNVPRHGIMNSTTFPPRNPQGFSKKKPDCQEKQLPAEPAYRPNCPNVYRPAKQLVNFEKLDDEEIDEESYIVKPHVSTSPEHKCPWSSKPEPPKVTNPFDFPTLTVNGNVEAQPEKAEISWTKELFREEDSKSNSSEENAVVEADDQVPDGFKSNRMSEALASSDAFNKSFCEEFNLDDPIIRIDCPGKIVKDPTIVIPKPKLVLLDEMAPVEVRFIEVYSPNQFWFQYNEASLTLLIHDMGELYSSPTGQCLIINGKNIKRGLIVAAKNFEMWHRAQVVDGLNKNGDVLLFFVDFGTHQAVNITDIRYLADIFVDIPVQALRGSILGAVPIKKYGEWNSAVCQYFYEKIKNKKFLGSIRFHSQNDDVYELEVFDQTKGTTIALDLISEGLAEIEEIKPSIRYLYPLPISACSYAGF